MFVVGIKLGQAMLISGSIQGKNLALSQPRLYFYPYLPLSWLVYAGLVQVFMINGLQMLLENECMHNLPIKKNYFPT